eukprot:TRINITY_DN19328_c0_g2_i1.p1 TRINITY_DN19328_c0_g2~~TRINITY_DN19328_c0_g2_i1.p1  ORF type:complete len:343 (-),score=76.76 TRINITY_DN19328_c0_g2_i1:114-1142(-)
MAAPVLVVGATGFVGSYVTRKLLQKGYLVRGTCRDPEAGKWLYGLDAKATDNLKLFPLTLLPDKQVEASVIDPLMKDCVGAFMCSGYEVQDPTTIDFMVNAGLTVLSSAKRVMAEKPGGAPIPVVLTSSTGSTNPPGAPADLVKNELTAWSDPEFQKKNGRFSPCAKTTMEIEALKFVGRNQQNEVVDATLAAGAPRLCILNPSLILAPQLKPGSEISGNGLPWFAKIAKGEAMNEKIPDDSMSMIHCDDLAALHVACMEKAEASGRYFGVNRSWCWEDILLAVQGYLGEANYKLPPKQFEGKGKPVTQFDNARRDSLGLKLRDIDFIVGDTLDYLKRVGKL